MRINGRTNWLTDMAKLIVSFRNFVIAPKELRKKGILVKPLQKWRDIKTNSYTEGQGCSHVLSRHDIVLVIILWDFVWKVSTQSCYVLLRILVLYLSIACNSQEGWRVKGEEVVSDGIVRSRAAAFPSSAWDLNSTVTQRLCSGVKGSCIDCVAHWTKYFTVETEHTVQLCYLAFSTC
jgi:hypothetical protein